MKDSMKLKLLFAAEAALTLTGGIFLNKTLRGHEKRLSAIEKKDAPAREPEPEDETNDKTDGKAKTIPVCVHASGHRDTDAPAIHKLLTWYLTMTGRFDRMLLDIRFVDDGTGTFVPVKVIAKRTGNIISIDVMAADEKEREFISRLTGITKEKAGEAAKDLVDRVYDIWGTDNRDEQDESDEKPEGRLCLYGSTDHYENEKVIEELLRTMLCEEYGGTREEVLIIEKPGEEHFTTLVICMDKDKNGRYLSVTIRNPYRPNTQHAFFVNIDNIRMATAKNAAAEISADIVRACAFHKDRDKRQGEPEGDYLPLQNTFDAGQLVRYGATGLKKLMDWYVNDEKYRKNAIAAFFIDGDPKAIVLTVGMKYEDGKLGIEIEPNVPDKDAHAVFHGVWPQDFGKAASEIADFAHYIYMNMTAPKARLYAWDDILESAPGIEGIMIYLMSFGRNKKTYCYDVLNNDDSVAVQLHMCVEDAEGYDRRMTIKILDCTDEDAMPYEDLRANRENLHAVALKIAAQAYSCYKKQGKTIE